MEKEIIEHRLTISEKYTSRFNGNKLQQINDALHLIQDHIEPVIRGVWNSHDFKVEFNTVYHDGERLELSTDYGTLYSDDKLEGLIKTVKSLPFNPLKNNPIRGREDWTPIDFEQDKHYMSESGDLSLDMTHWEYGEFEHLFEVFNALVENTVTLQRIREELGIDSDEDNERT